LLADQVDLLRRAERALYRNNPRLALGLVRELEEKHPSQALREESTVIRILASCALEDVATAKRLAGPFLEQNPNSVHAQRVKASCGAEQAGVGIDSGTEE
jgi:hypothetical protein